MMPPDPTADGYDLPTWPDSSDLYGRLCTAEAEVARLRAENERLEHDLAHLALHDGTRDARVGKPSLWRAVVGP